MASNLEEKGIWEQLKALKALYSQTDILHEAQVEQVKLWGRLVFQYVSKEGYECNIDIDNQKVKYVLKGGKLFEKKSWFRLRKNVCDFKWLVSAIAALDEAIHELLGDTWRLIIEHNGKIEYEGVRLKTSEQMKYEREQYRKQRNRETE